MSGSAIDDERVRTGGPAAVARTPGVWAQALAVLRKDLRAELRNRAALSAILLFAVTSLVVVGFATGVGGDLTPGAKAAVLWVVLVFAAFSGLAHVFLHEEERSTSLALRLTAAPLAVYFGKLLFNLLLLAAIVVLVVPLSIAMLQLNVASPGLFCGVLLAGGFGLGAAATSVAAIIAKARGKGALFGALGFPVLLPLVMMVVLATRNAVLGQGATGDAVRDIAGLLAYGVMLVTVSCLVFPIVWEQG